MTTKASAHSCPHTSNAVTTKEATQAMSAVTNQPIMTIITPLMRYTALSRPHTRSLSDEPIETMNTT